MSCEPSLSTDGTTTTDNESLTSFDDESPFDDSQLSLSPPTADPSTETTSSGVTFIIIGDRLKSPRPQKNDEVVITYAVWISGRRIPVLKNEPIPMAELPKAIADVLGRLGVGESARLWIPGPLTRELKIDQNLIEDNYSAADAVWPTEEDSHAVVDVSLHGLLRKSGVPVVPPLKPPTYAIPTASGISYDVFQTVGAERRARDWDRLSIRYAAFSSSGDLIATNTSGPLTVVQPAMLSPGWADALKRLGPGDRGRFWLPASVTDEGLNAEILDIEVTKITKWPQPPAPPQDLSPPPQAKHLKNGIRYLVLETGDKKRPVTHGAHLVVEYTAYSMNGRVVDSSVARGRPTYFTTNSVSRGLESALTTMVVGQHSRFWIPAQLTNNNNNHNDGELLFDIKVLTAWEGPG